MTKPNNEHRVVRADQTLKRYGKDLHESNLIDLLADAMHWCDATGVNFHWIMVQASRHYFQEVNDVPDDRRLV